MTNGLGNLTGVEFDRFMSVVRPPRALPEPPPSDQGGVVVIESAHRHWRDPAFDYRWQRWLHKLAVAGISMIVILLFIAVTLWCVYLIAVAYDAMYGVLVTSG